MKQIERDCYTLFMIGDFLRDADYKLKDIVKDYDREKVLDVALGELGSDKERLKSLLSELANDCYKRIKKKFPK